MLKDYSYAQTYQITQTKEILRWRDIYKGELYGNEVKGVSKAVRKVAKKILNWKIPLLKAPFLENDMLIKANPITQDDIDKARNSTILLNHFFNAEYFNKSRFIDEVVKTLTLDGTVFIRTGWEYETIDYPYQVTENGKTTTKMETFTVKNRPVAYVCRHEDIVLDPTSEGRIEYASFIIYSYTSNIATLKNNRNYFNLDKIKNSGYGRPHTDTQADPTRTFFTFSDNPRKLITIREYWGKFDIYGDGELHNIVCTIANDNTIIGLDMNPYPHQELPFVSIKLGGLPKSLYGESLVADVEETQQNLTAILRGFITDIAKSNNGQIGIPAGSLDPVNKKRFYDGDNFEFLQNGFWQAEYRNINQSAFNLYAMLNQEADALSGIDGQMSTAGENKDRPNATASQVRISDEINTIKIGLQTIATRFLAYAQTFLDEPTAVRITESEFKSLIKDDIAGDIDISMEILSLESKRARSQELIFGMQTLGNTLPLEVVLPIMAEWTELNKMPSVADKLRKFQMPKDPIAEERAKLENELLKAQIEDLKQKSQENAMDIKVKEAKARSIHTKADLDDLEFLQKDKGSIPVY